jgi:lysophospholipase L1-like esterase
MLTRGLSVLSSGSIVAALAISGCGSDTSSSGNLGVAGAPFASSGGSAATPAASANGGTTAAAASGGANAVGNGGTPLNGGGGVVVGSGGVVAGGGVTAASGGSPGIGGAAGTPAAGGSSGSAGSSSNGGTTANGGAGGVASTGGAAGGGGTGSDAKNPCVTKPSEIVLIGDSYITGYNGSPALQPALAMVNPDAAKWRNYAIAGISMQAGGLPLSPPPGVMYVPDEFTEAVNADKDIKVVVMDGGGNDALIPPAGSPAANCKNDTMAGTNPACQQLVAATLKTADALMQKMADAGVKNVIYFWYPHIPGGLLGGTAPNAINDYAAPLVKMGCEGTLSKTSGKMSCVFIDLRPAFGDNYSMTIVSDGVHPTQAGQTILANQIINTMKSNCIGQSSGCCSP